MHENYGTLAVERCDPKYQTLMKIFLRKRILKAVADVPAMGRNKVGVTGLPGSFRL